jgi:hypothetical protein
MRAVDLEYYINLQIAYGRCAMLLLRPHESIAAFQTAIRVRQAVYFGGYIQMDLTKIFCYSRLFKMPQEQTK